MRKTFFSLLSKETVFAGVFAGIALVALSFYLFPGSVEKKVEQKVAGITTRVSPTFTPVPTDKKNLITPTAAYLSTPTEEPVTESKTIQITIAVTPTPQPTSEKATISVSITGTSSFTVTLDKGKTHCDVLTQALQENKITQLLMKYDSSLDANGIYQINNLGKDNAVWWTYTVNGKSPSKGCNHIAANNGDQVNWSYVGSQ